MRISAIKLVGSWLWSRLWPVVVVTVSLLGCGLAPQSTVADVRGTPPGQSTLQPVSSFASEPFPMTDPMLALGGNVNFNPDDLDATQRQWYERLWEAVEASISTEVASAQRDDVYYAGRTIFLFNHALLLGLRTTGDLAFLDAVDEVAQAMRSQLSDSWCGGVENVVSVNVRYGTVTVPDGYLNFRLRRGNNVHTCRDTGDLNETLTHGHLALVMYAYHINRNNPSPNGIDYAERADFWLDYLRNHFEAKWRQRSNTTWPNMDFIDLKFCHTYNVMNLYFYFIGQRLASDNHPDAQAYLDYTDILSDAYFTQPYVPGERGGGFMPTNTPYGDAVVYSFGAPRNGAVNSTHLEACPSTYARYAVSAITTLNLEGHTLWNDAIMMKLANGMNGFVFDTTAITSSTDSLAAGVTGSTTVEGIPPTTYRERLTVGNFGYTTIPGLAIWDASGRIENLSLQAYNALENKPDRPNRLQIPVSMLLVESATNHHTYLATPE